MTTPHLQTLWPTPLLRKTFGDHEAVNTELAELFYRHRDEHGGGEGTVYSSSDDLLQRYQHPALQRLFQFVSESVFEVASAVNGPTWKHTGAGRLSMHIVGAWFQIQNDYGFHDIHNHGNCSWSGVYYVQIDGAARREQHPKLGALNGVTRFYSHLLPLLGGAFIDMGNAYMQQSNIDITPEAGDLLVFPSFLLHKAMPYDGDKDRIIVSFNAQVHGKRGDKAFEYGFA